jgi:hypothetical protein
MLLIPRWQQQQQHCTGQSINPSIHPRSVDSIWAAAASETARSNNGMETDGSMNERRVAVLEMMEIDHIDRRKSERDRKVKQRHGDRRVHEREEGGRLAHDGDGDIHFT